MRRGWTPASRPRAVLSSANLVGPTARGVPVASGVWLWPAGRVPVASPSGYREVDKGVWGVRTYPFDQFCVNFQHMFALPAIVLMQTENETAQENTYFFTLNLPFV